MVTTNMFHRAVAFGPTRRDANPKSVTARLKTDGQTVCTKTVEVDPARTVWTMARLVGAVDQQLRAGEWILGGSLIHLPIAADHEVTAVLDGFGEVSLKVDPKTCGRPAPFSTPGIEAAIFQPTASTP